MLQQNSHVGSTLERKIFLPIDCIQMLQQNSHTGLTLGRRNVLLTNRNNDIFLHKTWNTF